MIRDCQGLVRATPDVSIVMLTPASSIWRQQLQSERRKLQRWFGGTTAIRMAHQLDAIRMLFF